MEQLVYRSFGSRTKRISDYCFEQVRLIYQAFSIEFDPTWYPYLMNIRDASGCTVNELAALMGISQPGVSKMLKRLAEQELIREAGGSKDKRSKSIILTQAAEGLLKHIEPAVEAINQAFSHIERPAGGALAALTELESCLRERSLFDRVIALTKGEHRLQLREYNQQLHAFYERHNRAWLEKFFHVEPHDEEVLSDPHTHVLKKGGTIYIAHLAGYPVGGFTLMPYGNMLELAKMYVVEPLQGSGIGKQLLSSALQEAEKTRFDTLFLVSNRKLSPAIHLYKKAGFTEVPLESGDVLYERADIKMMRHIKKF
ncbi:MAG TPA: GNAT family N-acetyltransferase [Rickettsiales bacterium]|nr:GNAT family N-acetyltransferase [Rickettsiales bacterium]